MATAPSPVSARLPAVARSVACGLTAPKRAPKRADVAGGDPDERDLPVGMVAPVEEVAHGVGVVLTGVGVGELASEELVPGELGAAAGGGDDRRRRTDRVVRSATASRRPLAPRVQDDLGRIAHLL